MSKPDGKVGGKSKDAQTASGTAPPSVTVSKPAGSPATSSSRLPASSSSHATGPGSSPISEIVAALPVTEERNPKKPIVLLLVGAAVIAFMVVLIIGSVVLARKDAKKLSARTPMAATIASLTRTSFSAKTALPAAPVGNALNASSAPVTVSMEMANVTGIAPGHEDSEATGHVSSHKAMENPNSSSVSEHGLATEAGTLSTTSDINSPEHSILDTETVGAATEPANAFVSAAGVGKGRNYYASTDEAMNASGDEGMSVMKFSDSAVASLSSTMDVTVVRLDVSDNAQSLSTEEVEIAKSWTPGLAVSNDTTGSIQGIIST